MQPSVYEAALSYVAYGLSVLPILPDGRKSPDSRLLPNGLWTPFKSHIASVDDVTRWFRDRREGIAIIGGKVSGNLELIDFDDPDGYDSWMKAIEEHGWLQHIERMPLVQSPSGGYHLYYRCEEPVEGNQKLAWKVVPVQADAEVHNSGTTKYVEINDKQYAIFKQGGVDCIRMTMIETRGEGGYVVAPPSPAICHPSNKPYVLVRGDLNSIPKITPEQRNVLLAIAHTLDEYVEPGSVVGASVPRPSGSGLRPGEDYNARGDYEAVLEKYGWKRGRCVNGRQLWVRPGKHKGPSASSNYANSRMFYCFSSNGVPFEPNRKYSPYAVYTMLECNGDFQLSARELSLEGYGEPPKSSYIRRADTRVLTIAKPSDEWDEIVPFDTPSFEPFPIQALPEPLRLYATEIAESVQVPLDLAGMSVIGIAAAATRGRCAVHIGETHSEPTNLYILGVMPPASRKSDCLEWAAMPLIQAEYRMQEAAESRVNAAMQRYKAEQAHIEVLKRKAANAESDWKREEIIAEMDLAASALQDPPALPTLIVDDITVEALAAKMDEQEDESMAVVSAEGIFFQNIAGQYNSGIPNLDLVLKAHRGEPCKVDRMGRPPVRLAKPSLSLLILIQPHVVDEFRSVKAFKGRGLLARFLYVYPPEMGIRPYVNRGVDRLSRDSYTDAITAILDITNPSTKLQPRNRHRLNLRGDGLTEWTALYNDIEARMQDGGDLSGVRDWAGKLPGQAARIAGIFHLVKHPDLHVATTTPISADTMVEAWSVIEYLIPQALYTFGEMSAPPDHVSARRILEWIDKKKPTTFTKREVFASVKRKGVTYDEIDKAAELLCQHGHLRLEEPEQKARGRNSDPRYAVHPQLRGGVSDGDSSLSTSSE